ncbi:S41 family peptidase [Sphingobacterium psychroaquaticum]|uniref:Carboxyl-terminal processing protease n=1 Tax=Sphingobacterium psychroaquaticum TaxID=561061 RepID=A0A1X7KI16_9SPHI|nr:S41 family peptidase [Sphingobacterium psychroaquaticum]SMG40208.1 carboxyl-terminal processing protease [Sphingobacterium psychroaquaticum]
MQKGTKRSLFVAATYAAVLLLGILLGQNYVDEEGSKPGSSLVPIGLSDNTWKIQQLIDLISNSYVDSVNVDSVQNGAINHIISHLDPYSSYLVPNEAQRQTEILDGTFEGIGMEYFNLKDTLLVVSLINNGPADKAGFRVGDRLLRVNNRTVAGVSVSQEEMEKLIRGKRGTAVNVFVQRNGVELPNAIKVIRNQVTVSSLDVVYMIEPTVGYIKVRRFGMNTGEEFQAAIVALKKQGAKRLILDLRDNGGGYFHIAIKMASEFFKDRRLIVYTEGAHELRQDYFSDESGGFADGSLAVLINEETASASEIVTGAIQDWDRGVVIGRRSYGKGIVQEQYDFSDGSTVNLSIARYFTPLGRSIQKKYTPNWSNMMDFNTMYKGLWALDTLYNHGQTYTTKAGKAVYSGGGILPDIQMPRDSNINESPYQDLVRYGFIDQFVYGRFTKKLPAYSIENFLSGYNLPDNEYHAFIDFVRKAGIAISDKKKNELRNTIESDIEALVGRYYFGREAYFKVKNRRDLFVKQALQHFSALP